MSKPSIETELHKTRDLHRILLEEYEELEILTPSEIKEIETEKIKLIIELSTFGNKYHERYKSHFAGDEDENFNTQLNKALPEIIKDLKTKNIEIIDETESKNAEEIDNPVSALNKYRYKTLEIIRQKIYKKAENDKPTALCLSGGGIRSATFCLGVLQGLAKNGLLDKFDYLSTVSGGGYIGSWLSAWHHREGNMDKVQSALCRNRDYPYLFGLGDFKIDFEDDCLNVKNELDELIKALENTKDLFKTKEIFNDIDILKPILKEVSPDEKNEFPEIENVKRAASKKELRDIYLKFCRNLNQIIHNEKEESKALKKAIIDKELENDAPQLRKKIKREIIEHKLKSIVKPLDDFEHIEPPEITYLRTYSNFMSPRTGLFSIDTWTIVAIYLRNLLLNWTVFLPLIAIFLLVPKLFSAIIKIPHSNYENYVFWFSIPVGIFAVVSIIAMRPSLSSFSWIKQKYKIKEDGTFKNAQSKVWRWCLLPLVTVAFLTTMYWIWVVEPACNFYKGIGYLKGFWHCPTPEPVKWYYFVLFYMSLFLGGFLIAHSILLCIKYFNPKKIRSEDIWMLVKEFCASFVSGALGGVFLYVFANLLHSAAMKLFVLSVKNQYITTLDINTVYVIFGPSLFLTSVLISTAFFFGIAGKIYNDMDREWLSRFGAIILMIIVGWSVLSGIVLISPHIIESEFFNRSYWINRTIPPGLILGVISGLITLILGFSGKTPATEEKEAKSIISTVLKFAPLVAAPVFALFLIILISYGTGSLMNFSRELQIWQNMPEFQAVLWRSDFLYLVIWIVSFGLVATLMGLFININKFSLHAMYRERLIRAYLGASRSGKRVKSVNSFTDLDDKDNVEMYELGCQKPFHVVNMTLNLGKANNLRWQDRKAASFTATSLHCGSSNMGDGSGNYRKSEHYGCSSSKEQAITLGTVAAISGAAVSPSMGYYSMSPAVSFLMALFNLRLGWWLGNPGKRGDKTYNRSAPYFSPSLLYDEAFGDTTDTNKYVYLSDGGHFDNLGLYEMVLRRCHFIIACDAGADSKFGFFDLGTAIHKIRVDMGIPIDFEAGMPMQGRNCAIAKIKYSAIDGPGTDGILIYIKPTLDGDEPIDVVNYKNVNPDFPHETTGDEFYSETQFESYRSLGVHMINSICNVPGKSDCYDLSGFQENAEKYLKQKKGIAKKVRTDQRSSEEANK